MNIIYKTPAETFPAEIDCTDKLPTGETPTSATVTVFDTVTDADVTATIKPGSVTVSGNKVFFDLVAGTNTIDYLVKILVTSSTSKPYEASFILAVRSSRP